MKTAITYFILGLLFTFLAIRSAGNEGTMWNLYTIILAGFATLDIGMAIRFFRLHLHLKNDSKNK